jgi:hypothetical protein
MRDIQEMRRRIAHLITASIFTLMFGTATIAFGCFGVILSAPNHTTCSSSPCTVTVFEPSWDYCGTSETETQKTCVYEGTYELLVKLYVDGTCANGQCGSAVYDSEQDSTDDQPKPKLVAAQCSGS